MRPKERKEYKCNIDRGSRKGRSGRRGAKNECQKAKPNEGIPRIIEYDINVLGERSDHRVCES